jgi:aspartyl-tRNA(Asn)/glutamyl-tRNA(Gln) amidotransferase subunit C
MKITREEVETTAALARLALTDEERDRLVRELDAILLYMEKLAALDVSSVEPMTHAVALSCPLRDDARGPQLGQEAALAGAPDREEGFFRVPRIIAHDKETG